MITRSDILSFGRSILEDKDLSEASNPVGPTGNCQYYNSEINHHCLVGYWLHHKIGIPNDILATVESKTADFAIRFLIQSGNFTEEIENSAIDLLRDIQQEADNTTFDSVEDGFVAPTWGEVVRSYVYPTEEV